MDLSFNSNHDFNDLCSEFDTVTESISLKLVRCVEETVDSLAREQRMLDNLCSDIKDIIPGRGKPGEKAIDPEDNAFDIMEKCEIKLQSYLKLLHSKMGAAAADPRLNGHHEDAVIMEYDRTIDRLDNLLCLWGDLIASIKEHDADVDSEVSQPFDNADDLIKSLRS